MVGNEHRPWMIGVIARLPARSLRLWREPSPGGAGTAGAGGKLQEGGIPQAVGPPRTAAQRGGGGDISKQGTSGRTVT